jgi:hypothetical protein
VNRHGLEKGEDEDERGFEMEAQTPQQSVIDLPNDVDRVLRDYESAWAARDAEALSNLFTPDGFVLRPGSPLVRGRDAILDGVPGLWRPAGPEAVWLRDSRLGRLHRRGLRR